MRRGRRALLPYYQPGTEGPGCLAVDAHSACLSALQPWARFSHLLCRVRVLVHRKGATRAFPPHHPQIPDKYKASAPGEGRG